MRQPASRRYPPGKRLTCAVASHRCATMTLMRRTALFVAFVAAASAALAAFEPSFDPRSLAEAIQIGQSSVDDVRSRFNAAYHVTVGKAPVDLVEIVTPFRRIVLDAESHAR